MKISVLHIILKHYDTLRDSNSGRVSFVDLSTFIGLPLLLGLLSAFVGLKVGKDFYSLSVTFFGIFIALLLNIQVAVFGVFQRSWSKLSDEILDELRADKISQRRGLLRELNVNVSYLIVVSCVCLVAYIILFSLEYESPYLKIFSIVLYAHFMLSLLMVIKRTHALFQGEYDIS